MTNKTCRKCGRQSGAYNYCGAHRKENRAKARARRQSSAAHAHRLGSSYAGYQLSSAASFPTANGAYYIDQDPANQDTPSSFSPASTVAPLLKVGA